MGLQEGGREGKEGKNDRRSSKGGRGRAVPEGLREYERVRGLEA